MIGEINAALNDIGYSLPGENWTYWDKGPAPGGEEWLTTEERGWSIATGKACASNLLAMTRAPRTSPSRRRQEASHPPASIRPWLSIPGEPSPPRTDAAVPGRAPRGGGSERRG